MSELEDSIFEFDEFIAAMDSRGNVPGFPTIEEIRLEFERRRFEDEDLEQESKYCRSAGIDAHNHREERAERNVELYLQYNHDN